MTTDATQPIHLPESTDGASASHAVDLLLDDLGTFHVPPRRRRVAGTSRAALVVDSVPIARKFLAQRLSELGYEVSSAESGELALTMVQHREYAIVFLEQVLEGEVDGLILCQTIKRMHLPPGRFAPAVVFTVGRDSASDRVRGSLAGCDGYLAKPLLDDDLRATLREVDPLFA